MADLISALRDKYSEANLMNMLDPANASGWEAEGKRLAVNLPEVTVRDAAKFVAEMTPILGDAIAAKELWDMATSDNPNWPLIGAMGGATVIGLIPGIGDAAAKGIKAGARKMLDTAKRVEVDPNSMGSMLGNVRLKPKGDVSSPAQEVSGLLASGRSDEVTDEMLGKLTPNDNMELFELYQSGATGMDLPMDEASRMARAKAAGFEGGLFHGTGADIVNIDKEKFGLGENLLGKGFYTTSNPKRSDIYVPIGNPPLPKGVFQSGNNEYTQGGNILPLMTRSNTEFDARQKTGKENALNIGEAFKNSDFDVEVRDSGDQVFIKSKTNPDLSVYIDSYQDGMITLQKLKDVFGRGNVTEILEQAGFSGLKAPESSGSITKVNYNPEDVRSRFARFDPRLSNLKNLSAGLGVAPLGLMALLSENERNKDGLNY